MFLVIISAGCVGSFDPFAVCQFSSEGCSGGRTYDKMCVQEGDLLSPCKVNNSAVCESNYSTCQRKNESYYYAQGLYPNEICEFNSAQECTFGYGDGFNPDFVNYPCLNSYYHFILNCFI
jgi:hypothetical protein